MFYFSLHNFPTTVHNLEEIRYCILLKLHPGKFLGTKTDIPTPANESLIPREKTWISGLVASLYQQYMDM